MTAISTVRAGRGPVHVARIGWERGRFEVREFFRQRESVVFTLLFPIILLLFFTQVVNYKVEGGITFAQYFVPAILAVGLFGASFQTLAIQISTEREKGFLKRLEGTPMPPAAYFIGKMVMIFSVVILETIILLGVSALMGKVKIPTDGGKWLTWLWVTVLGVAAGAVFGMAFSSVARSAKAAPAVVTPVALVLQFISGVFFVFTTAPHWLQITASLFPLRWIAQGYRSVFLPDSFAQQEAVHSWEHGRIALVLAIWTVGGLLATVRTFRWRSDRDS
ncbi:MAG: ABC transporter [Actinobacteria bacterium 13_2_20CM_2_72_6]|nr:MAG: ABC transporter [Actinobacteria bacterium 13_2_20CM_2_72_6]